MKSILKAIQDYLFTIFYIFRDIFRNSSREYTIFFIVAILTFVLLTVSLV